MVKTHAREGFIREQGNLVGELRTLLKRVVKLALAERLRSGGNMGRRLAVQFRLDLGLISMMIVIGVTFLSIVLGPTVYRRPPLAVMPPSAFT